MKYIPIIILLLLANIVFAQEKDKQPRFAGFLTSEEIEQWHEKISVSDTLEQYIIQLVTSKEKDDYFSKWICLQIFERKNNRFTQEIDLTDYEHSAPADWFENGDFNFDGYPDFSLYEASYNLGNSSNRYFLFDPATGTFFESGFEGTNLSFDSYTKTITTNNRCCAGTEEYNALYKLIDNQMILLEKHCLEVERDKDDNPLGDEDGSLIMTEVDCDTAYIDVQLQSARQKKNFQLRMAIYDKEMYGGFVQYKGQKERIPIYFYHAENIEEDESRADGIHAKLLHYNEMYNNEDTGNYCIVLRGKMIEDAWYIRKKDKKTFTLQVVK